MAARVFMVQPRYGVAQSLATVDNARGQPPESR
jgi:hypothetical protein